MRVLLLAAPLGRWGAGRGGGVRLGGGGVRGWGVTCKERKAEEEEDEGSKQ